MKVEIYDCDNSETLDLIEVKADEVPALVALVKEFGFEDTEGKDYKFESAKVWTGGFIVYIKGA